MRRTSGVDAALATLAVKKNAVAVGVFDQALVGPDLANVSSLELIDRHPEMFGQRRDLLLFNPNEAGGAAAAIAACGAFEP